jgi:hypothetical protein
MIKSKLINLAIILIGSLFVLYPAMCFLEEVQDLGVSGLMNVRCLFLSAFDLPIGLWCILGGYSNLKSRSSSNARSPEGSAGAKWLIGILSTSVVCMVVCYVGWGVFDWPEIFGVIGMVSTWVMLAGIVIVFFVLLFRIQNRTDAAQQGAAADRPPGGR